MKNIFELTAGSILFGTDIPGQSDVDLVRVVLEDPKDLLGFSRTETWQNRPVPEKEKMIPGGTECTVYGLRKFMTMLLSCNPSIITLLYASDDKILVLTEEGKELIALKNSVISHKVKPAFLGFMREQRLRLLDIVNPRVSRPELIVKYGYDTKYAYHVVRLGLQGLEFITTGSLKLPMKDEDKKLLLDIRNGKLDLADVLILIEKLDKKIFDTPVCSSIRKVPDTETVESWMIKTYHNYLKGLS